MKRWFRYLRVSWSVACGLLCILLIALWVRGYWKWDYCRMQIPGPFDVGVGSEVGIFAAGWTTELRRTVWEWDPHFGNAPRYDLPKQGYLGFSYKKFPAQGTVTATAPCWFVVLLTSAIATAPWLPYRFSLRTLLIAVTFLAVALGTVAALSR